MRPFILFIGLALASELSAQIVIGEGDMPDANDTFRYRTAAATGLDLEQTGAAWTWDMSALLPQAEGADTTVSVGSTPFLYQLFFNNNFLFPEHRADYGVKGVDFGLMALTLSDVFDYYRADGDGFFNVGFGANLNGLPTSVRRVPTDRIYSFPLEFGDTDVSASAFNVSVPTVLYFGQDQVRTTEVDGWGTLYLPADTFEVLRVKSTLQRTDTIFIEQFGFGFRLPEPETIEYKWLAAGMGKPVLEVTTTGGIPISTEFYYVPEEIITGTSWATRTGLKVYPNPTSDALFVAVPDGEPARVQLVDVAGRMVVDLNTVGGAIQQVDLTGLANGVYTLGVQTPSTSNKTTIVVQR